MSEALTLHASADPPPPPERDDVEPEPESESESESDDDDFEADDDELLDDEDDDAALLPPPPPHPAATITAISAIAVTRRTRCMLFSPTVEWGEPTADVGVTGLEPVATCVSSRCSTGLSYTPRSPRA